MRFSVATKKMRCWIKFGLRKAVVDAHVLGIKMRCFLSEVAKLLQLL